MKFNKKTLYNILFYSFIIFLFTPYGKTTKAKLIQGVIYVKSMVFSPAVKKMKNRVAINSFDTELIGIYNQPNLNLKELKGKVIFINYWATWCAPCIAEMPSVQSLYNDYKNKIAFVFITSDSKIKITKFYQDNNYNLPTYNLASAIAPEISTKSLPTTFIVTKNGKIALKETGASNWNSTKVRQLLNTLINE
ncbi:MAG: TlpA family protein disulfide reductase [Flavobacteriaceae bacterium]|nr:TlpA family protein disulfide reductase [Flavobacteriaceae bacterium]